MKKLASLFAVGAFATASIFASSASAEEDAVGDVLGSLAQAIVMVPSVALAPVSMMAGEEPPMMMEEMSMEDIPVIFAVVPGVAQAMTEN